MAAELSSRTENMFTMLEARSHSQRKRQMSNVYAKSFLQNSRVFKDITQQVIQQKFLAVLDESVAEHQPIAMYSLLCRLTMDAMSAYIFGLANGTSMLENPRAFAQFDRVYAERGKYAFIAQEIPFALLPARLLRLPPFTEQVITARNGVDDFCTQLCEKTKEALRAGTVASDEAVVFRQLTKAMMQNESGKWESDELGWREIGSEVLDHLRKSSS